MFYTTKGLILRETQYKDNDKLLDVLTGDMGRITVKARGVRRKNSRLRSGCQLLCYSELTLFEKNGFYTVNEAEPLEMFMGLRTDIELLSLGSYFAQLLSCISDQDQASPELLSLGLNSLYALDKLKKPQALVKAAFELRLMALAGYYPELSGCGVCGEGRDAVFLLSGGKPALRGLSEEYAAGGRRRAQPGGAGRHGAYSPLSCQTAVFVHPAGQAAEGAGGGNGTLSHLPAGPELLCPEFLQTIVYHIMRNE